MERIIMESLVSVIVPVYNVEEYLDNCVESIINQTYRNLEIILIDDESPDLCPQKCDSWAEKDSRIRVIHKKNAGVSFARNDGLDVARGAFITFVDSDDYLSSDAIEVMLKRIEQDQSDLVIAQCAKVYPNQAQKLVAYPWISDKVITQDAAIQMMGASRALPVYLWGKLYRSHIFNKIRFPSLTCAEDVYVLPEIMERCSRISLVERVLYFYYQRSTSIVHSRKRHQIMDSIVASLHVSRYFLEYGHIESASRFFYSAVCQSYTLKNRNEASQQIKAAFDIKERRKLRKAMDRNMVVSILAAKFPHIYAFYNSHIKR